MSHMGNLMFLFFALTFTVTLASAGGDGNDHPIPNSGKLDEEEFRVPVIDLGPWYKSIDQSPRDREAIETFPLGLSTEQQDTVQRIRRACREVGFFQITGVPVSNRNGDKSNGPDLDETMDRTWRASRDFFELPIEEKLEHTTKDNAKYPYGYERSETLTRGKVLDGKDEGSSCDADGDHCASSEAAADLKETFSLGPPNGNGSGMPPRRWIDSPNISPDFRLALEAYYERMEDLALVLLEIFAIALEEPADFFRDKMDHHMSALRLVHYYPLENNSKDAFDNNRKPSRDDEEEGVRRLVRAGAHTDYGALTILAAQDEGLEVLLRDTTGATTDVGVGNDETQKNPQTWYPVPLVPGAFIINLGDLMQRWTNNEWVSTMHRVVMPSTKARERRYSMAFFVNINGDTPIEPLKCCRGDDTGDFRSDGRVITAGEHLMAKHLASMGITADEDGNTDDISK